MIVWMWEAFRWIQVGKTSILDIKKKKSYAHEREREREVGEGCTQLLWKWKETGL